MGLANMETFSKIYELKYLRLKKETCFQDKNSNIDKPRSLDLHRETFSFKGHPPLPNSGDFLR